MHLGSRINGFLCCISPYFPRASLLLLRDSSHIMSRVSRILIRDKRVWSRPARGLHHTSARFITPPLTSRPKTPARHPKSIKQTSSSRLGTKLPPAQAPKSARASSKFVLDVSSSSMIRIKSRNPVFVAFSAAQPLSTPLFTFVSYVSTAGATELPPRRHRHS